VPEDERGTVVGPGMLEGSSYLPAPLGVWGGGLRVRIAAGRLRQEECPIFATLPLITPRPIPAQSEAHVCRDTAEMGPDPPGEGCHVSSGGAWHPVGAAPGSPLVASFGPPPRKPRVRPWWG
jgi:hypothetical protein